MSDYIDRDLLLAEIKELKKSPWYNGCGENYERIIRSDAIGVVVDLCIKSAPAVDVQKIKHGKWKLCYEDWRMQIAGDECSACGFQHYGTCISHYHYCPNCGAKMEKGESLRQ